MKRQPDRHRDYVTRQGAAFTAGEEGNTHNGAPDRMSGNGRRAFLQDEERRIAANIAKLPELLDRKD